MLSSPFSQNFDVVKIKFNFIKTSLMRENREKSNFLQYSLEGFRSQII